MAKGFDANVDQTKKTSLGEIGKGGGIEPASDRLDLDTEAFMHEMVTIMVHPSNEEGQLDVITPNINGINQPIVRGQEQVVKRKYVEALARCRTTKFEQQLADFRDPASHQMVEKTVLSYPFAILKDSDKGKAWMKGILAER